MLNVTSSVLYRTVTELAPADRAERALALFYTGTIGSGAISPVLYGVLGDYVGAHWATAATGVGALAISRVRAHRVPPRPRIIYAFSRAACRDGAS